MQCQNALSAYLTSKQMPHFGFEEQGRAKPKGSTCLLYKYADNTVWLYKVTKIQVKKNMVQLEKLQFFIYMFL